MFACLRARVRAYVRARVRECVCVRDTPVTYATAFFFFLVLLSSVFRDNGSLRTVSRASVQ